MEILVNSNGIDSIPGSWWQSMMFDGSLGCVSIRCPKCKKSITLRDGEDWPTRRDGTHGHKIADDGTVDPSIVCPYKPCTWHVNARLENWIPTNKNTQQ